MDLTQDEKDFMESLPQDKQEAYKNKVISLRNEKNQLKKEKDDVYTNAQAQIDSLTNWKKSQEEEKQKEIQQRTQERETKIDNLFRDLAKNNEEAYNKIKSAASLLNLSAVDLNNKAEVDKISDILYSTSGVGKPQGGYGGGQGANGAGATNPEKEVLVNSASQLRVIADNYYKAHGNTSDYQELDRRAREQELLEGRAKTQGVFK